MPRATRATICSGDVSSGLSTLSSERVSSVPSRRRTATSSSVTVRTVPTSRWPVAVSVQTTTRSPAASVALVASFSA